MPTYAEKTRVPVQRSRDEIIRELGRFGAEGFMYAEEGSRSRLAFKVGGKMVRFDLDTGDGTDQEIRAAWRALVLVVKAKLVAVNSGVTTFEREFLADLVLPGDVTVGAKVLPALEACEPLPPLLPPHAEGGES